MLVMASTIITWFLSAISFNSRASSVVATNGFSQMTFFPASNAALAILKCKLFGTAT